MTLALALAAAAQAFPTTSARVIYESWHAAPATLSSPASAPTTAAVNAAEARLRELVGGTGRNAALARLALGEAEAARGELPVARGDLEQAAIWDPVRDAATAALVRLFVKAQDAAGVLTTANRYPIAEDDVYYRAIATAAAQAAVQLAQWNDALRWAAHLGVGAQALWNRAQAEQGLGEEAEAARLRREIVIRFPGSTEAAAAGPIPGTLTPEEMAQQAAAWERAGNPRRAAEEFGDAGKPAEAARAWLAAGEMDQATALVSHLVQGSARAQALEIEVEIARHATAPDAHPLDGLAAPIRTLGQEFPTSSWYARALHEASDEALIEGNTAAAEQYLDLLWRGFPDSSWAPGAEWRAAWMAYRQDETSTPDRMEAYVRSHPHGAYIANALYWRGRWAAAHHGATLAQQCYRADAARYPGSYFGQQAAALASRRRLAGATPSWLRAVTGDPAPPRLAPAPAAAQSALERAAAMYQAGLYDDASEIMHGVLRTLPPGGAALRVARQVARVDGERNDWFGALQAMLHALPDYATWHGDQLPANDWERLFPAPYRADIHLVAAHDDLDRYLLWGLIRQESGFDPRSLSNARARGLMQLELGTARGRMGELPTRWRSLAGGSLTATDLFNPSLNLALGAAELHGLLERFPNPAQALAAYNAGVSRVLLWDQFLDGGNVPAPEFIESIPFGQTREYVQAVLRNEVQYRRIYGR